MTFLEFTKLGEESQCRTGEARSSFEEKITREDDRERKVFGFKT